ncbi:hypothetical protein ACFQV2_34995 [Actinokineospora soli]|uniref:Uncharacterized protein n=1 Tax=Actinokineospora soli TaxID=1048753 RepID=A0ABW2TYQ4_9PSEU
MDLLRRTAAHAADFLAGLDARPVAPTAGVAELRKALGHPLTDGGVDAGQVVDDLVRDTADGLLATAGGRFYGWVIGGSVPAALAADWLVSAWDQNAAMHACGPRWPSSRRWRARGSRTCSACPPTRRSGSPRARSPRT